MSKLSYSLTIRILEVLPRVVDPEPTVLNSALIEHPSATLPPLDLTIPREKSLFDQLLEGQENRRIGNRCEFDYVASPRSHHFIAHPVSEPLRGLLRTW